MSEDVVQLPPDGAGTKLRMVFNTSVASGARQEVVTPADPDGTLSYPSAQGRISDPEQSSGNGSVIALLKRLRTLLSGTLVVDGSAVTQPVTVTNQPTVVVGNTIAVTGTFWQAVQPVSGAVAVTNLGGLATEASLQELIEQQPGSRSDPTNVPTAPLGASQTYTGTFQECLFDGCLIVLYATQPVNEAPATVAIEWSNDGSTVSATTVLTSQQVVAGPFTYVVYLSITNETFQGDYYRLRVTNGAVAQTNTPVAYVATTRDPFVGSFGNLNSPLTFFSQALLVRSVEAGLTPDQGFINQAIQGRHTPNCTTTLLAANAVFRGTWFEWQANYVRMLTDVHSDQAGTMYVDLSEDVAPVNGDESSVDYSIAVTYLVSDQMLRRAFPVQSRWVRVRYINGPAAQADFELDSAFLTNDTGIPAYPLRLLPLLRDMAGVVRNIPAVGDGTGGAYHELPVDSSGIPTGHVVAFDPDVHIGPVSQGQTSQKTAGTAAAVRLDPIPLAGRVSVALANMEATNGAVYGHTAGLLETTGFDLPAGRTVMLRAKDNLPIYIRAKAVGGGNTNTQALNGTGSSGTATNPANAKISDGSYANLVAVQTVDINTYAITPTLSTVAQVLLRVIGKKQTGQTQTVAAVETKTGSAGNVGSVTSAVIGGGSQMTYLCAISRESAGATVTGVSGLGLTWTQVRSVTNGSLRTVDVWVATGGATSGTVVATFSANATNSHIAVTRFTGVDLTTPVQNSAQATGNSSTPATAGIVGTIKGMVYMAAAVADRVFSAGSGWTLLSAENTVGGSNLDGLGTEDKGLLGTGSVVPTGATSGGVNWAAIGITLLPAVAVDPQITISYKLSGVAGVTSAVVAFSSTSNATTDVDITGDRVWVFADVPNVDVIATGFSIGDASADIDVLQLVIVETSAPTARVCLAEYAT